jgi:hypothetical protein
LYSPSSNALRSRVVKVVMNVTVAVAASSEGVLDGTPAPAGASSEALDGTPAPAGVSAGASLGIPVPVVGAPVLTVGEREGAPVVTEVVVGEAVVGEVVGPPAGKVGERVGAPVVTVGEVEVGDPVATVGETVEGETDVGEVLAGEAVGEPVPADCGCGVCVGADVPSPGVSAGESPPPPGPPCWRRRRLDVVGVAVGVDVMVGAAVGVDVAVGAVVVGERLGGGMGGGGLMDSA